MGTIRVLIFIWLGTIFVASIKMLFDQNRLLKTYRKTVNPPYPILPGESNRDFGSNKKNAGNDLLGVNLAIRRIKIVFIKDSLLPEVTYLARKVRIDFVWALSVGIGGFGLIVALIAIKNT